MPITSIPIGVETVLTQNVVYAVPSQSVEFESTASLESSLLSDSGFVAFAARIVTGCFVRCTTANATVTLRKNYA